MTGLRAQSLLPFVPSGSDPSGRYPRFLWRPDGRPGATGSFSEPHEAARYPGAQ